MTMESEIRVLNDVKSQIEKAKLNFKKSPKERITESYVTSRLEALEIQINKFSEKHELLIKTYTQEHLDKTSYIIKDDFNSCYETYLDYKSELKNVFSKSNIDSTKSSSSPHEGMAKLPKITIPRFSGKYCEWSSFRDLFTSLIHNNPSLDDVQRLHYLKTQVTGEAELLIKHIPVTQSNYKKCWDLLQNRYNNKRFMSNCILNRLFSQRSLQVESANGLKELLDTTSECMHELSNLGIKISTWDVIIIYIISSKLDAESRKQWELQVSQSCEDFPSFDLFKEFIETRFRALEFIEPNKNKFRATQSNPKVLHATSSFTFNDSCPHCSESHKLHSCKLFAKEDIDKRREIVKSLGVCFNCFGRNHSGRQCRISTRCHICHKKHHTLVHPKNETISSSVNVHSNTSDEISDTAHKTDIQNIKTHFSSGYVQRQTLLATALLKAEAKNGYCQILRALLDQGSQASFISEAAVQLLKLNKIATNSSISGLGGGSSSLTSKYAVMVNIQSLHDPTFTMQIKAYVLKTFTSILPDKKFPVPDWTELHQITLADPQYNTPNKIDMLLGAEVYCNILKEGLIKLPTEATIAQDTYLGWVVSGQVSRPSGNEESCHNVIVNMHVLQEELDILRRFWEIESEPSQNSVKILNPEEQACEDHFNATTVRDESGRYIVELPFRCENPPCKYGRSRSIAVKRLQSLEKRLMNAPDQRQDYANVLHEYLSLGHMEKACKDSGDSSDSGAVYLPHHAVIRMDKTTTKTRLVFNASSQGTNGVSLNDTLMVGPTLQPELRHLIMRWRMHPICLTADIVKMYRQIKVAEKHVDFQRIVWRDDPEAKIEDFRLLRVTFGTACAPYLAVKALQQTAIDEGSDFPLAASRVKTDFYMDDLMTGCQSETEAVQIYAQMNGLLERTGFTLQKWSSNRFDLLEKLKVNTGQDFEIKMDEVTKILGLTWNRSSDEFDYTVKLSPTPETFTKRSVISEISRLYDPLGWIAPCIITSKVFIQKLWLAGLDWDDELPTDLQKEWETYRHDLSKLVHFHIPRWLACKEDDSVVELHGFSDASNVAYGAAVYIRTVDAQGNVHTNLITAKTKVAPIKKVSIPRLELCGADLLARLLFEVANILNVDKAFIHAWTDSTVVLAWLSDHPSRWKTFVANRTTKILDKTNAAQWSYVQSKDNPADLASRGMAPALLLDNQLWKEGPPWLQNVNIEYKKPRSICTKTELEIIKSHTATFKDNQDENEEILPRFSSLRKLVRVIAFCRRITDKRKPVKERVQPSPYLAAAEIRDALKSCIKLSQNTSFGSDVEELLKNEYVNKRSRLVTLSPYIDSDGILRVGGRLQNANLPNDTKHPIILSDKSHLSKLIVAEAHEKSLHGGNQLTINYIRTKYWLLRVKNLVRSHIHSCVTCIRNAAVIRSQLMGQLPSCRVTPLKPFLETGVDYAGPIDMRASKGRGHKSHKGYICLFVCMSTRAVHIEAVSDLTSQGFLAAYKRFVARRGRCQQLWSDNGTNFVGASKELKSLFDSELSSLPNEIAASLANNGTEWKFIPPHAPHFGGLWEAGIKSAKHHLKRVIGDTTLTYEEMATVLSQVESCLNSRPLSQASSNPDDDEPLTPGHFLVGEPLLVAPDVNYESQSIGTLRRWQLTQRMVQSFWNRWSKEYLTEFFQRHKWNTKSPEPKVGDVVIVKEDNLPPTKWLHGRVVHTHPGKDNITRVVTLRYRNTLIKRPTSKLCLLPINEEL